MKLYLPALALLSLAACNQKTSCRHDAIGPLSIQKSDSTLDTMVRVITYAHGSNFATPLDTTYVARLSTSFPISATDDKDWVFTSYPDNKTHKLKDIKYGTETGYQSSGFTKHPCTSSITCYLDDSLVCFPAEYELDYPTSHIIVVKN